MDIIKFHEFLIIFFISVGVTQVSTSCQNKYVIDRGLSCSDKELILEMHNQLRQSVALGQVHGQPAASAMMLISWDEELAKKAQNLADTCHYGHDSNNARRVSRFYVGQNIATTWSTWEKSSEPDFPSQIKAWFNEVDTYSFSGGFNHETGHYSQMVWGDTYLIGCGYTYFYDGYKYQKIYVCNYGPGGNVQGKTPYYPGQPSCDYFGMISSSKYYGLCDSYRSFYPDYSCYRYRRDAKTSKALKTALKTLEALKLSKKTKNSKVSKGSSNVTVKSKSTKTSNSTAASTKTNSSAGSAKTNNSVSTKITKGSKH